MSHRNVFLTGATGLVGAATLRNLLRGNEHVRVSCLVRGGSVARLERKLTDSGYWQDIVHSLNRIELIDGDCFAPNFNLSPKRYAALADHVDCVVHLAADINCSRAAGEMQDVNVTSVQHMFDFATAGKKAKKDVHFMSSIASVLKYAEIYTSAKIPESLALSLDIALPGYGKNKWDAEQLIVRESTARQVRSMVYRCPMIVAFQEKAAVHAMVQLAMVTGAMHVWDDFMPKFGREPVAEAIAAISKAPLKSNSRFPGHAQYDVIHLAPPQQDRFDKQAERMIKAMDMQGQIEIVSMDEYLERLDSIQGLSPYIDSISRVVHKVTKNLAAIRFTPLDTKHAGQILHEANVNFKSISEYDPAYTRAFASQCRQHLYEHVTPELCADLFARATNAKTGSSREVAAMHA